MNSRNSNDKLILMDNKDIKKYLGMSNINNNNSSKNYSVLNVTEKKITNLSNPSSNNNLIKDMREVKDDNKIKPNTKMLSPGKNMHRVTKSNFLFDKDVIYGKGQDMAKKLISSEKRVINHATNPTINSVINTHRDIHKNVYKLKNFPESTKSSLPIHTNPTINSQRIVSMYKSDLINGKKILKK